MSPLGYTQLEEHFSFAAKILACSITADTAFRIPVIASVSPLHKDPPLVLAFGAAREGADNLGDVLGECTDYAGF